MTDRRKTISLDFDGVLHAYDSGWQGAHVIRDSAVPGAIKALRLLVSQADFEVCIFSSRNAEAAGVMAMRSWLAINGLPKSDLDRISFPIDKPPAHVHVDDRCLRFNGEWGMYTPTLLREFRPWNKA